MPILVAITGSIWEFDKRGPLPCRLKEWPNGPSAQQVAELRRNDLKDRSYVVLPDGDLPYRDDAPAGKTD